VESGVPEPSVMRLEILQPPSLYPTTFSKLLIFSMITNIKIETPEVFLTRGSRLKAQGSL
jgi:hypothetical protein